MTWTNPPTKITEARDILLQTAAMQTLLTGLDQATQEARFHYPGADPATATLPYIVLSRTEEDYSKISVGGAIGSGTIQAVIHLADSVSTGTVEALISIAQQLVEVTGDYLYVTRATATLANEPPASQDAGDESTSDAGVEDRSITIFMEWEG